MSDSVHKPYILRFVTERINPKNLESILKYDQYMSCNRWTSSDKNFSRIQQLLTKTEAHREEDDQHDDALFL